MFVRRLPLFLSGVFGNFDANLSPVSRCYKTSDLYFIGAMYFGTIQPLSCSFSLIYLWSLKKLENN